MICRATNKRRYHAESLALIAAAEIIAAGRDVGHRPLNVFRCEACQDWHVGHRPIVLARKPDPSVNPVADPVARCECACRKPATTQIHTHRGPLTVCAKHAERIFASFGTQEIA